MTEARMRRRLGLGVILFAVLVVTTNNMAFASATNLIALFRLPADAKLVPTAVTEASLNPALPRTGCVLLWSNEGIFATAMRRPICTRYMYPVYASADREADLLQQIVDVPPAVVVFDSPFWSMNIYGRTMQQRLPTVDQYLRANYDFISSNGYVLGVRRPR